MMKYNDNKYFTSFLGADFLETLKDSPNQSFTRRGGQRNISKKEEGFFFNKFLQMQKLCDELSSLNHYLFPSMLVSFFLSKLIS